VKVAHVPFCFRPDAVGGTEVYVEGLAREQTKLGDDVVIAAPAPATAAYAIDGLQVRRFATGSSVRLETLYGAGDRAASSHFGSLLDRERPDVVHLHALTSAVSIRLVDEAHLRGKPVVFTYHTPTVSCARGTLLRDGQEVCDGTLTVQRCSACTLQGLGVGRLGSAVLSRMPAHVGKACGALGLAGSLWTGVQYTHLLGMQQASFRELLSRVERVVVLCNWARDVLIRNGLAEQKVTVCRHGLVDWGDPRPLTVRAPDVLRVAFLGRLHPTKGADVLIRAVRALEDVKIELHVFGIEQGTADTDYARELGMLARDDPRIRFHAAVPSQQVIDLLRHFDVLAVPSRWLETGPLVVLEAFAAGIPVVGSNLGGIAELVTDGVDGVLVEPDYSEEWAQALAWLARNSGALASLRDGVQPPRRMSVVASEMRTVYDDLTGQVGAGGVARAASRIR